MFLIKRTDRFTENLKAFDLMSTEEFLFTKNFLLIIIKKINNKKKINNNKKRFFVEIFLNNKWNFFFYDHSYRLRISIRHLITKNLNNYRIILNRREEVFFSKKYSWIKFSIIFRTWKWFQCKMHIHTHKQKKIHTNCRYFSNYKKIIPMIELYVTFSKKKKTKLNETFNILLKYW